MKAMGKYGSLVLQNEISGASEALGTVLESIPETINGTMSRFEEQRKTEVFIFGYTVKFEMTLLSKWRRYKAVGY